MMESLLVSNSPFLGYFLDPPLMDSITDICKYHFLCFVTIIQVKVIFRSLGKKGQTKKFVN